MNIQGRDCTLAVAKDDNYYPLPYRYEQQHAGLSDNLKDALFAENNIFYCTPLIDELMIIKLLSIPAISIINHNEKILLKV